MRRLLPLVVLSLAASLAEADDLRLEADVLDATALGETDERVVAEGHVRAEAGPWRLRAPRLEYDAARRMAVAEGGFVAMDGAMLLSGARLSIDLAGRSLELESGSLTVKRGADPALLAAHLEDEDRSHLLALGTDALTLKLGSLERLSTGALAATDVWLTTCDCRGRTPLIALSAGRVEVVPGDRVVLRDWVPRLFDHAALPFAVPIPLTVPLDDRRTGVLFPELVLNGPGGVTVGLPLFVELGESADVTLRTRWSFGTAAATSRDASKAGTAGLSEQLEFRWRPAEDAEGALRADLHLDRTLTPQGAQRGLRTGLALTHAQGLLGGRLSAKGEWLSDNALLFDTQVPIDRAQVPYLRSSIGWSRALGTHGAAVVESVAMQDLRAPAQASPSGLARFGASRSAAVMAPVARASAMGTTTLGPVELDGTGALAWEAGWPGHSPRPGHARRLSAEASLAQRWALVSSPAGSVALEAGERVQGLSTPDSEPRASTRRAAYAGLLARLRAGRTFAGGWRHDVVPSLRVRALYGSGGYAPALETPVPQDGLAPQGESDLASVEGHAVQAVARLWSSLTAPSGAQASAWVEPHVELAPWSAGQWAAGAGLASGRWAFAADAAWSGTRGTLDTGGARLVAPMGEGTLSAGARYVASTGSDQLARPLDALFSRPSSVATTSTPVAQGDVQASVKPTDGLGLTMGAVVARALADGAGTTQQYLAGASWDFVGCARLSLMVRWAPTSGLPIPAPAVLVGLELWDPGPIMAAAWAP